MGEVSVSWVITELGGVRVEDRVLASLTPNPSSVFPPAWNTDGHKDIRAGRVQRKELMGTERYPARGGFTML
jgi:hypothetical protein